MKTFKHNGKMGDLIYSLPTIRELGGGILFIPQDTPDECKGMYDNLKPLLEQQPFIHEVREYPSGLDYMDKAPGIPIDYDLDLARLQPAKGIIHIVKRYMDAFGIKVFNWKEPWLTVEGDSPIDGEYVVINYTGRHVVNEQMGMKSRVNWKRVIESIPERKIFVGTAREFTAFEGWHHLEYITTKNALELARVIKGAKKVYCNQSCCLAISQGISKEYYLDAKPGKTNCLLFTPYELML